MFIFKCIDYVEALNLWGLNVISLSKNWALIILHKSSLMFIDSDDAKVSKTYFHYVKEI